MTKSELRRLVDELPEAVACRAAILLRPAQGPVLATLGAGTGRAAALQRSGQ